MPPINPATGSTQRFSLFIGHHNAGYVSTVKGGNVSTEMCTMDPSAWHFQRKVGVGLKFNTIEVQMALGMARPMVDWINETLNAGSASTPRDGGITTGNAACQAIHHRNYYGAVLSELNFPACSGDSKDVTFITLKMDPTFIERGAGGALSGEMDPRAKDFTNNNFNFTVKNGLHTEYARKVEAFQIKQEVVHNYYGNRGWAEKVPGKCEIGKLTVSMAVSDANKDSWEDWVRGYMIDGMRAENRNLECSLEYLDAGLKSVGEIELGLKKVQDLTDKFIKQVEDVGTNKEKEIMEL